MTESPIAVSHFTIPSELRSDVGAVSRYIEEVGADGLELVPSYFGGEAWDVDHRRLGKARLRIVSIQSLLYGLPPLSRLMGEASAREGLRRRCLSLRRLTEELGPLGVVLGSPNHRKLEGRVLDRAISDFEDVVLMILDDIAEETTLFLESNPEEQGSEFLSTVVGVQAFIGRIGAHNLGLNLDTACLRWDPSAVEWLCELRDYGPKCRISVQVDEMGCMDEFDALVGLLGALDHHGGETFLSLEDIAGLEVARGRVCVGALRVARPHH